MPIKIQGDLPVKEILERENIFVMDEGRAIHQDIRPIQILILNLMLTKIVTKMPQLLKLIGVFPQEICKKISFQLALLDLLKPSIVTVLIKKPN